MKQRLIKNQPTIRLDYGLSLLSFPGNEFSEKLADAYTASLYYGFTRVNDYQDIEGLTYFASEFAYISNISSHLKPMRKAAGGITSDTWQFGLGIKNGYGWMADGGRIMLFHSGGILLAHTDFEQNAAGQKNQDKLNLFDEDFRFGSFFSGGAAVQIFPVLYVDFVFERSISFPRHQTFGWYVSWTLESLVQSSFDFFQKQIMELTGAYFPLVNFAVKNAMSAFFYEMRRKNMNWPIESASPLTFTGYKISLNFTF